MRVVGMKCKARIYILGMARVNEDMLIGPIIFNLFAKMYHNLVFNRVSSGIKQSWV